MQSMGPLVQNPTAFYIALGLYAIWLLPLWGDRVLAFLRNFRKFREGD